MNRVGWIGLVAILAGGCGGQPTRKDLLDQLSKCDDSWETKVAIMALNRMDLEDLRSDDPLRQFRALADMRDISAGDERFVPPLIALAKAPKTNQGIRERALRAIAVIGESRTRREPVRRMCEEELLELVRDPVAGVRQASGKAIISVGNERTVGQLRALVGKESDPAVRQELESVLSTLVDLVNRGGERPSNR